MAYIFGLLLKYFVLAYAITVCFTQEDEHVLMNAKNKLVSNSPRLRSTLDRKIDVNDKDNPVVQGAFKKPVPRARLSLKTNPACYGDIANLCGDAPTNFDVLECIQNKERSESNILNQECHHLMWQFKMNITKSGHVEDIARDTCAAEVERFPQCKDEGEAGGHVLTCMTQFMDQIEDEKCKHYMVKLAAIIFSDYRLISHMTESCSDDINNLHCGRLQPLSQPSLHSQAFVIECLSRSPSKLSTECHKQILRLAELQADDFHLDRPLFFACRDDREKFCRNVIAGHGKVYKCLMKHKMERTMSKECVEKLTARQQLIQEDYKVSKGLARSCRSAIQELSCRRGVREGLGHDIKLSVILLCLEDGLHRGVNIDTSCQEEMLNHRRMLMENYQLNPDLVVACKLEIKRLCGGGKEIGGRTLHCLMKYARRHSANELEGGEFHVSSGCKRKLEDSIKVSDVGEDWRIDPVLHEACQPVVERGCPAVLGGQARVIRCLMKLLGTPIMTGSCETALLEIQYFVARDWKLDPQLYTACYNDSVNLCHGKRLWSSVDQDMDPERGALVLPCLFRNIYHTSSERDSSEASSQKRVSEPCTEEVRRVMHERSAFVDLHPEIEVACMYSLASICSEKTKPGEEIFCLQQNLDNVSPECKVAVSNYTEAEVQDVHLNSLIMIHCATLISKLCEEESRQAPGEGAVMDCLIQNKNTPDMRENTKCRAVIESFQIITMKDISFTPKFKKECLHDVPRFCAFAKTKKEVVDCLSMRVRDDILSDDRAQVSRGCRVQLRNQLLQRHSSSRLDPELQKMCRQDIQQLCVDDNSNTPDMSLECLRKNRQKLSASCHEVVFRRTQEELIDPGTDPVLLQACHQMIRLHCNNARKEDLLSCLKRQKDEISFSKRCKRVVVMRMIEQNTDIRLNPELSSQCRQDISQHCAHLFNKVKTKATEINGKIVDCLEVALSKHKLSETCETQIVALTREAAFDYRMDAKLSKVCKNDVQVLCVKDQAREDAGDRGAVTECLKLALELDNIKDEACQEQVALLIEAQRVDIHADPMLYKTCSIDDAKFCGEQERGKHLACLFDVLNRNNAALEDKCRELLRKRREMFEKALSVYRIDGVEDMVQAVYTSHKRNYILLVLFSVVGAIFVVGLFCGRSTRKYKLLKNR